MRAVLLILCAGSAFSSPAAPPALGDVDAHLEAMERSQAAFEGCAGTKRELFEERNRVAESLSALKDAAAACRARVSADKVSVDAVVADPELGSALFSEVLTRQVCLALAQGDARPCGAAAGLRGSTETGEQMCRRLYLQSRLAVELISGAPNPRPACEAWCYSNPVPPPADLVGRVCPLLLQKNHLRACSLITQAKEAGYSREKCELEFRSLLGDEAACAGMIRPGGDVCLASAAFKKAKDSSDSGACGKNPLCRAMMGEGPGGCGALDDGLMAQACSEFSPLVQREAGGALRSSPRWAGLTLQIARLDRDCIAAREKIVSRFDPADRILKAGEGRGIRGFDSRRAALGRIIGRQKELDGAYLSIPRSGAGGGRPHPYAGDWTVYNTPKAKTGCCGGQGHASVGLEQNQGDLTVDESGAFILFSQTGATRGVIDPSGSISGDITDSLCGGGIVSGFCGSPRACSGTYSQSGGAVVDGESGSESGVFRLSR